MTVAVIIAGLLPIFWGHGTGSEIMSRIEVPMMGGMITAPLLGLFVIPAAYRLMRLRQAWSRGLRAGDTDFPQHEARCDSAVFGQPLFCESVFSLNCGCAPR
jgi:hypothetical protein